VPICRAKAARTLDASNAFSIIKVSRNWTLSVNTRQVHGKWVYPCLRNPQKTKRSVQRTNLHLPHCWILKARGTAWSPIFEFFPDKWDSLNLKKQFATMPTDSLKPNKKWSPILSSCLNPKKIFSDDSDGFAATQ
jgi:hypothetical protein